MSALLRIAVATALGLALAQSALAGGDAQAGKEKASKVCAACHGPNGDKPSAPDQPILAGQWEDYLARALSDYKSGKRQNPIMNGMAGTLSKQDIQDIAAWFSSRPSRLHSER
jgi:cytochrome c553